ncbi:transposase [Streptomyces sp. NBC_01136]|nr:transposase [Streptomyces sp. NBC_01136]
MPYATDLSDEQWALIEPLVTAWKQERVARSATGDPGSRDLREVVNALLYQNRTGCQWRLLPQTSRPGRRCSTASPVAPGRP